MEEVKAKPLYEVGYHLLPTVTEEEVGAEVARVREAIESRGGSVVSEEWPKSTQLAYDISHYKERSRSSYDAAYFGWIRFEMERDSILDVQKTLESIDAILRFIVVSIPREGLKRRVQKRRTRTVLGKKPKHDKELVHQDSSSAEEIDREIEKLIS